MRIAYFDCFSGISGNMVLGALLDAGLELERLQAELAQLKLPGYRLAAELVRRGGLSGTLVRVDCEEQSAHRHLSDVEAIIDASELPAEVRQGSKAIFRRLAQAEAQVHGRPVEQVHFHEVGAIDAIVDIVGAAVGLWLLGVVGVFGSAVRVGRGTVQCAHGLLPVPAPATLELLRGVPIYGRDVEAELVTPTGAAILTALARGYGDAPPMRVERIGYGAGSRELPHPNLLRVTIGETADEPAGYEQDRVTLLETNIDDMNPQLYEHAMERLFAAGALDVYLTPVQMKRNRPGTKLSALVADEQLPAVLDAMLTETTAIGVRATAVRRWKLAREQVIVQTRYGPIEVKVARRAGRVVNVAPEYRACRAAAAAHRVPLKEVQAAALETARAAGLRVDG